MSTVFEKINPQSVSESAMQVILKKILSGELKSGDRLPPERELALQMGISRSSLHQAILELEARGFVVVVPRRGNIISDYRKNQTPQMLATIMSYGEDALDHKLFADMMDTRRLLECESARLACDNITEELLKEMEDCIEGMENSQNNPVEYIYSFHYALIQASGNSLYCMIFRGFEPILRTLITKHYNVNGMNLKETITLNRKLLGAIREKKHDEAMRLMSEVLAMGVDVLELSYR